jgi:hypothetical protein
MSTPTIYDQTPAQMTLKFVKGDMVSIQLTFNKNLTGYTFSSGILGTPSPTFTVTNIDLPNGIVSITLSSTDSNTLSLANNYTWFFKWTTGGATRTVLDGNIELSAS